MRELVRHCKGKPAATDRRCLPSLSHSFTLDFVCAFQDERDAERFYRVLGKRLGQYGLELSREKTRLLGFSRHHKDAKSRFDFLGLTFLWGKDRTGQDRLQRQTARSRLRKALGNCTAWIKQVRNHRVPALMKELNSKLRGYYNYYGVRGNFSSLAEFFYHVERLLYKWLNRRSQKASYTWPGFRDLLKQYAIARPRITEPARKGAVTT